MSQQFELIDGMKDILPDEHTYFTFIKKVVRHRCRQSGFRRITPSFIESKALYEEIYGENSTQVASAFHTKICDDKKEDATLNFDLISSQARAYVEHSMHILPQPVELYAIEPIFKAEKVGTETLKQSLQFSAEAIGENDPAIDAQLIFLAHRILKDLGVGNQIKLHINTIGDAESRKQYTEDLKNFYCGKEHVLGEEGKKLLETNPIQLLRMEDEDMQILAQIAPKLENVLTKEAKANHETVLSYIKELGIEFVEDPQLIPEEPYFTHTIFEFRDCSLKDQPAIIKGGRHNTLIKKLGAEEEVPAVGFTASFERIEDLMKRENITIKNKDTVHVFVAQLGAEAKQKCLSLLMKLRDAGIHAVGALGKGSMREQLSLAEKFKAPWAVLMGQIEVLEEIAIIRNMDLGSQEIVAYDDVIDELINRIGEDDLDKYTVGVEETIYKDGEEQPVLEEDEESEEE